MGYIVVENTPGYLPDSDPCEFRTLAEAQGYARALADELRENGYQVSGNSEFGYYAELDADDLGRIVEVIAA